MKRCSALVGIGVGLLLPLQLAFADCTALQKTFEKLSAEWWQWVFSIPSSENPMFDTTGERCMVGQRGSVRFLPGTYVGAVTRTCTVPEGAVLFFPLATTVFFDSPKVCGQDAQSYSVESMRETVAASIDGVTSFSAKVDGEPVEEICRVQSRVYAVALPEENVFDALGYSPCPAGIYSPTVDEGYYVRLKPLPVGQHRVRIRALNPDLFSGFEVDVTYKLNVVAVNDE